MGPFVSLTDIELQRLRAEVLELRGALDAERLARMRMEGRLDDLLERFENLVRERDSAEAVGAHRGDAKAVVEPVTTAGADAMAALAAAHAAYLRDESVALAPPAPPAQPEQPAPPVGNAAEQPAPPVGNVAGGDAEYWARYRVGSWQGEVRDGGGGADDEDRALPRKVATNLSEADYWAAYG